MERETGIEPATNSLEGCDSTTELLPQASYPGGFAPGPPTRSLAGAPELPTPLARLTHCVRSRAPQSLPRSRPTCLAEARPKGERRRMAREGFEPSKPLGRQIYSLLRLTASLPRRISTPSRFSTLPLTAEGFSC